MKGLHYEVVGVKSGEKSNNVKGGSWEKPESMLHDVAKECCSYFGTMHNEKMTAAAEVARQG